MAGVTMNQSEPASRPMVLLDDALCARASRHGFAVARSESMSAEALAEMTTGIGPLMFTPGERPHPDNAFVFVVTNRGRSDVPRSVFHSDTSYVLQPPSFTVLAAVEIPASGGETVFINQFEAWQSAGSALRRQLQGVEFLHVASRVPDPDKAGEGAWHPVVRRHPTTGQDALYVSALRAACARTPATVRN